MIARRQFYVPVLRVTCEMYLCHLINCTALLGIIYLFSPVNWNESPISNQWQNYGWMGFVVYMLYCLPLLGIPQSLFNFLGLIFFQSFPDTPTLKVTRFSESVNTS